MPVVLITVLSTATSFACTSIPSPAPTSKLTVPVRPPPVKPAPAVTPVTVPPIVLTATNDKLPLPSVDKT